MKKSELRQMIREMLYEELSNSKCNLSEAASVKKRYVLSTKEAPTANERVFIYLDQNGYNYKLGNLLDLALSDYEDSVTDARETANNALDTLLVDRLFILQANNLKCVDSFDYLEEN
jgi:hypothetical protein